MLYRRFFSLILYSLAILGGVVPGRAQTILLPVEVLGPDQAEVQRRFALPEADYQRLSLQIHNFSKENKVSVRFNDGNWRTLNSDNVELDAQSAAFGGIGGGYGTLSLSIDVADEPLTVGDNTIHFRFNGENDVLTIGYRVLRFNVLDADGHSLIDEADFGHDDPADWQPPRSDAASISEGKQLWETANLTGAIQGGAIIRAKCGDCHAQDGRDLKYFNYSNKAIVQRTIYHGLSPEEGEKIASYIRSLDVPSPADARPWNPPYQPGPSLDDQPTEAWAAGAGLESVLESDEEMMEYLFPNGTSEAELERVFDLDGTLNIREMPVALQLPDWRLWLPRWHPKDMMSEAAYQQLIHGVGGVRSQRPADTYGYARVRENLEAKGVAFYNDGTGKDLMTLLLELGAGVQDFLFKEYREFAGLFWWTTKESYGIDQNTSGLSTELYKMNLAQWNAVKHWEIMQEFGIEDVTPRNAAAPEARQWPMNNWTVFAIAPHIIGDVRGESRLRGQDRAVGLYLSTAWYQLQMVLNSGMRTPQDVAPVDWSYNFDHITKPGIETGHTEPLRLVQNFIKAYQQRDNEVFSNNNALVNKTAWNMREVSPWRLYSTAAGDQTLHQALDDYEPGLRAKVTSHLLRMFMEKVNSLELSDWPRAYNEWEALEPADHEPSVYSTPDCLFPNAGGGCTDIQNAVEADAIYTAIPLFQEIGVDCEVLGSLRAWAQSVWPAGDWDRYAPGICTGVFTTLSLIEQNSGKLVLTLEDGKEYSRADVPSGLLNIGPRITTDDVGSVVFDLNEGERVFTDNRAPFLLYGEGDDFEPWTFAAGDYTITVRAYAEPDGAGDLIDEATYRFTVTEDPITAVEETEEKAIFYPNPADREVWLRQPADWQLFGVDARLLASGRSERVPLTNIRPGVYLLRIDHQTERLIISR